MGSFAGLLAGIGDDQHEKHVEDMNNALGKRKNILDLYSSLLQNPNYQDATPEIISEIGRLSSIEPGKLQKEFSKGYQIAPILEPSIQRGHANAQQNRPPNMAAGGVAPPPPTLAPGSGAVPSNGGMPPPNVGMDSLNPSITTMPGQPAALTMPQVGPPPAQVAAQADAIGQMQGATSPEVHTVTPASAAGAFQPPPSNLVQNPLDNIVPKMSAGHPADPYGIGPEPQMPDQPPFSRHDPAGARAWAAHDIQLKKYLEDSKAYDELKRTVAAKQTQEKYDKTQRDAILSDPKTQEWLKTLPAGQRGLVEWQLRTGMPLPGGIGASMSPHMLGNNVPGASAPPGQLDNSGNPIDPTGNYTLRSMNGQEEWIPRQVTKKLEWASDPANPQQMKLYEINPFNPSDKKLVTDISKVNPAMMPTVTNGMRSVPQPDGSIALIPMTTSSGKSAAGKTASVTSVSPPPSGATSSAPTSSLPKGAVVVGGKSLNPEQIITNQQRLGALDNTIEIAQRVQRNLPLLANLIDAGKIQLQTDANQGIIEALINRSVSLTPQEAQLAGDFVSLSEHINTLRGPLGATGFRGPEAFGALMSQRGQLMANPDVTSQVLSNTMKALNRTRNPIAQGLKKSGVSADTNGSVSDVPDPARPKGVPADATWNPTSRTWEKD